MANTTTTTTKTRPTGDDALYLHRRARYVLCKYADPTEGARIGLTEDEAREIMREDPSLIFAAPEAEARAWFEA
ncbi:MAG TPA: hypothetical protein VD948_02915 [Rhodothermales bacterium]|nr:hypothetical protein [Rhodothermales bacterium]